MKNLEVSTFSTQETTFHPIKDDLLTSFQCNICSLTVECKFGKLEFEKLSYKTEVYYLANPFEIPDYNKNAKKYSIDDFLVLGANCLMCSQQVCLNEGCSIFYNNYFCSNCVFREKHDFPLDIVNIVQKKQKLDK